MSYIPVLYWTVLFLLYFYSQDYDLIVFVKLEPQAHAFYNTVSI